MPPELHLKPSEHHLVRRELIYPYFAYRYSCFRCCYPRSCRNYPLTLRDRLSSALARSPLTLRDHNLAIAKLPCGFYFVPDR